MGQQVAIQGDAGTIRHGYHEAASLRSWRIAKDDSGAWALTATVLRRNTYRTSQHPLVFEAAHTAGVWRWPIERLQMTDGTLIARLGPRERHDGVTVCTPGDHTITSVER